MQKVILRGMVRYVLSLKPNKYFFLLLVVFFLISCSGEPPELHNIEYQLLLINNNTYKEPFEYLSLFFYGEDEDGIDDIDKLYLINDDNYTMWDIPSDRWVSKNILGTEWMGFNSLMAPGDGHFPEGNYRVLIVDLGGESAETTFFLRNRIPEKEDLTLPEVIYDNETVQIQSDFPTLQIWYYDSDDNLLEKSKEITAGNYQWNQINRNIIRRANSFSVYSEPKDGSWGLISGPFHLKK